MLMIGDGVDTASRLPLSLAMKVVVHMSEIEIVAIWTPSPSPSAPLFATKAASQGRESLKTMSEETGGRYFAYTELKEFDKIRQEVNAQYLMEYQSTNSRLDNKFRKIRVESVNKNYKVRHREGYFAK
jgi:VWFA-related protein